MDYKDTLNLPKTDFPMKANLTVKEPEILRPMGGNEHLSTKSGRYRKDGRPTFSMTVLLMPTAISIWAQRLNKMIKDIVIKSKNMSGLDSIYVPGWDCHGLPIEHQVDKELGDKRHDLSQAEKRRCCRTYAERFVGIQRDQFKRLGVFGEWENPYLTMSYDYEAVTVNEFGKLYLAGNVYKGKKPVYWCATCKTALAEAEVEYNEHHTPSIYVKFRVISDIAAVRPKLAR